MTDDELAMAYADGELDPLAAHRVEGRLAREPALAEAVAAQRRVREALSQGFDPLLAAPVPKRLTELLRSNVLPLRRTGRATAKWPAAAAIAASVIIGIAIGHIAQMPVAGISGEPMIASGTLAQTLDNDLAGGSALTRVLVSFRQADGSYCRVFTAAAIDGIACHNASGWVVRRADAALRFAGHDYQQATSRDAEILARAQHMMTGDPFTLNQERSAIAHSWRSR